MTYTKEQMRQYQRERRAANPDKARAASKAAYEVRKAAEVADSGLRERRKALSAAWKAGHPEAIRTARQRQAGAITADPERLLQRRKDAAAGSERYRSNPANRRKLRARWRLLKAVQRGRVIKTPCVKCGDPRSEGHHHLGYAWPLAVTWLCRRHHGEAHRR